MYENFLVLLSITTTFYINLVIFEKDYPKSIIINYLNKYKTKISLLTTEGSGGDKKELFDFIEYET